MEVGCLPPDFLRVANEAIYNPKLAQSKLIEERSEVIDANVQTYSLSCASTHQAWAVQVVMGYKLGKVA